MKIATAAYPLSWFDSWTAYEIKLTEWVSDAAAQAADLLVFPEYGAMELASLGGETACAEIGRATTMVSDLMGDVNQLHRDLAARFGVHILGASAPVVLPDGRIVNRAHLHSPTGQTGFQDKQIMTLWEREPWGVEGLGPVKLFDTALGKLAINICYDSEFPLLARAQRDADLLLVPSCTDKPEGYWRVRIGTMARALENQCVAVMASTVGACPWLDAVDTNCGMGGIFAPPDAGFPDNGVIAEGRMNHPGWTYGRVDIAMIAAIRTGGNVRNRAHWDEQDGVDSADPCVLK